MTAPLHPETSPAGTSAAAPAPVPCATGPAGARTWDPSRDPAFFRVVAHLFPPPTTLAMTVLLASYDEDEHPVPHRTHRPRA